MDGMDQPKSLISVFFLSVSFTLGFDKIRFKDSILMETRQIIEYVLNLEFFKEEFGIWNLYGLLEIIWSVKQVEEN